MFTRRRHDADALDEQVLYIVTEFIMKKFFADESGATAIEYGLIAAAMGVCLIAAMPLIATPLKAKFGVIGAAITTPGT
jgi:pilus assembly protein Flp/PilA